MKPSHVLRAIILLLTLGFSLFSCKKDEPSSNGNNDISNIIADAYIYAYPIILMKITEDVMTNVPQPAGNGHAPVNQISHIHVVPDYNFTNVVSPNVDTFYSIAWLNLDNEPMVVSVPDATLYKPEGKDWRYYLLQLMDAWSNVFASPGVRTTSTGAQNFIITGPNWSGVVPGGMIQYASPTNMVWINGRTFVKDQSDIATVVAFQNAISLMPLSAWPGPYVPPIGEINDSIDTQTPPNIQVANLSVQKYFQMLCDLLPKNPAAPYDSVMVRNLAKLGITPGGKFDLSKFSEDEQVAIENGYANGKIELNNSSQTVQKINSNGWGYILQDIGTYGNNYETRAFIALIGLGANLPEDAVYPTTDKDNTDQPLNTSHEYTITFPAGQTPPAQGFWSITMYNDQHFLVQNQIDRYAIGSYNGLQLNNDSSLTLYIQKNNPGNDKESNWLPTSEIDGSSFNLMMRIYWPGDSVLNNQWEIPAVVKVN
jgi:hypothetical protein